MPAASVRDLRARGRRREWRGKSRAGCSPLTRRSSGVRDSIPINGDGSSNSCATARRSASPELHVEYRAKNPHDDGFHWRLGRGKCFHDESGRPVRYIGVSHDIQEIKEEAQQTFTLGHLDLESKAKIDSVYWQLAQQIVNMHRGLRYVPEEVKELETSLGDQYICNFSVFQSLLDHWAL